MRYPVFILIAALAAAAQDRPNCTGMALDFDARCGCVKDPNSQLCSLVKAGAYEPVDWSKIKQVALSPSIAPIKGTAPSQPAARSVQPRTQIQPQTARVVQLTHTDFLRFIGPDAQLAAGIDFGKVSQVPDIARSLFGSDGDDNREKVNAAFREVDHLWMSFTPPGDRVVVMTGRFEKGVAAGMFYARGVRPVFLGGAHAMMIGSEPSIQAALARLAQPASNEGWIAKRARELSKDHEVWIANQPGPLAFDSASPLKGVRQFALGVRASQDPGLDGDATADSDASAESIQEWMGGMKAVNGIALERAGSSLRFTAKGEELDAAKAAMASEFGVELYSVMMAGFPGMPLRTVAQNKLQAVKLGMKRDEVLALLGKPISVTSIQGLDTPRETWIYQVPFGKQFALRLDGGVVNLTPR